VTSRKQGICAQSMGGGTPCASARSCATVKKDGKASHNQPPSRISRLRRLFCGRLPVGHRLLLGPPRAQRDERRVHGALPLPLCLSGHVARGLHSSPQIPSLRRRDASPAPLRLSRSAPPVSAPISRPGAH